MRSGRDGRSQRNRRNRRNRDVSEWRYDMSTIETTVSEVPPAGSEQPSPAPLKTSSRWLLAGLAVAAAALGTVIYSGIHERAHAETALGIRTERAAVPTVNVVLPTSGEVSQEIVLP